jgi:hypothetical protein
MKRGMCRLNPVAVEADSKHWCGQWQPHLPRGQWEPRPAPVSALETAA